MSRIRVPGKDRATFRELTRLSPDRVSSLQQALQSSACTATAVREALNVGLPEDAADVLIMLNATRLGLNLTAAEAEMQARASVDDLGDADLASLLDTRPLVLLAKSTDLESAAQRGLQSAQVITDIRPVPDATMADGIGNALIINTLQLVFMEAGHYKEAYISMSPSNLVELRATIDHALEMTDRSWKFLEQAGVSVMTEREEGTE